MFRRRQAADEPVTIEEQQLEEERITPSFDEMQRAIQFDREYIDIQKESMSIDIIEMLHFFNELPSRIPRQLLEKNEEAIDYFRTLTGVYVGNPFEFYQTIVLFYYKNWHNPEYPFFGSKLDFVFSKVAQNMLENLMLEVQQENYKINELVLAHPKAFYLHEDNIELHANRFMRRMITFIPSFDYNEFYTAIESEFVALGNEINKDILDIVYSIEHRDFSDFDSLYTLVELNDEIVMNPDIITVRALNYFPVKHVETIRILQFVRIHQLQKILYQGLQYDLSTQIESIKTVRILEVYLATENHKLFSQNKIVFENNQRFLNLFFDSYYFEKNLADDQDSPKVRSCLKNLLEKVNDAIIHEGFVGELEILVKKAYYDHQLLAGN